MKKQNRTTTLESLLACVGLICCDTREQFIYYYKIAMKDNNGSTVWYHINKGKK